MSTLVNVARFHLVDRLQYVVLPLGVTAFAFLVNLVIFTMIPVTGSDNFSGGLSTLYVLLFVPGTLSMTKSLPFGFALGLSRRTYFRGTILLALGASAGYALAITVMQAVERATGGWGLTLHFFRVPWILDGAWYLTWLTSFVLLVLAFVYGMWFGLVYRRWQVTGLMVFGAAQITAILAAAVVITWANAWPSVGALLATMSPLGVTGVLAVIATALVLGGFATMRRVTV